MWGTLRQSYHAILLKGVTKPEVVREVTDYPCAFSVYLRMGLGFTLRLMLGMLLYGGIPVVWEAR